MDRELEWLEGHREAAVSADTWEQFCKGQGPLGEHYLKYRWLAKHWEFLKERGFLMFKPVLLPKARAYTDLFESAKIIKQVYLPKGKGSAYPAPAGFVYIAEPTIAGHYGGTRSLDHTRTYGDGEPIRQHFGASWYVCYVKPRFDVPAYPTGRNFSLEIGSLEAISRDGMLIIGHAKNAIGSDWIALLDEGDSLESLLSVEDQEFLARERKAEAEAYEVIKDK